VGTLFDTIYGLPTRRASTWYFGDGALLMNQILGSFVGSPATGRITPLDPVLQSAAGTRGNGFSVGFRVARDITPRFGAEFTLDAAQGTVGFTDAALAGIEASRASFVSAWNANNGLIATGGGVVFTNASVTSTADIDEGAGRQLFMTGALTINLATRGRLIPYAAVGAGVVSNTGDLPSLTLTGNYRFASLNVIAPGTFPVDETDTVTMRLVAASDNPFVTVFGGGVKFLGGRRWGLRGDVRAYVSQNTVDVVVDAAPQVASSLPLGIIASTLIPSIQFSNFGVSLLPSNLSGPAIDGFTTFSSSGTTVHFNVSAGYFVRF
jgi:hypothetical protein